MTAPAAGRRAFRTAARHAPAPARSHPGRTETSPAADSVGRVSERWGREQVIELAPSAVLARSAQEAADPARWHGTGCDDGGVWGEYRTGTPHGHEVSHHVCAEPSGPAFGCSCPSPVLPCIHVLALLLLWSDGGVRPGDRPAWTAELLERRRRAARTRRRPGPAPARASVARTPAGRASDPATVRRREQRVDDGVAELSTWLRDRIGRGLARHAGTDRRMWADAARRMVDRQAPGLATALHAIKDLSSPRYGADRPDRMLAELGLLALLLQAHRRRAELPEPLRATVRARIGFPVPQEEVLREGERVRDEWYVAGSRDVEQDRVIARRVWLRGRGTGRSALVLSFAPPGRPLDSSLTVGTAFDGELAFYPGAQPLRALVAERHGPAPAVPQGTTVDGMLQEYADALARDPWLDAWPAVLQDVRLATPEGSPVRPDALHVMDPHGDVLPLCLPPGDDARRASWRLLAVSGGAPFTVAGEWSPDGLRPLSAWHHREGAVAL